MSQLCLLSDDKVERIAAFDITESLDLYDSRFGNAGNNDVLCPTCNMRSDVCMGHHALLHLGEYIFNPIIYKECQEIINSICIACGANLNQVSKSKANKCSNVQCNTYNHGDYVIHAADMNQAVGKKDSKRVKLAQSLKDLLPPGCVISKVLIPPIHLRTPEEMKWSTELQKLYEKLIVAVRYKKKVGEAYRSVIDGFMRKTKNKEKYVFDNNGIIDMISGKDGVFRQLMMGKRLERSARAVIVGDPSLKLDQVAVPKTVAECVRIKLSCTRYNIDNLKSAAQKGKLWWPDTDDIVNPVNILEGMSFQRVLMDGDLTMLNRQPSLSRVSLMCFKVVIRDRQDDRRALIKGRNGTKIRSYKAVAAKDDEQVFAINPQVTQPFNADFDGDEMDRRALIKGKNGTKIRSYKAAAAKDDEQVFAINPQVTQPFNADFDGDEMNLFFMSSRAEMIELCHNVDTFPHVQDLVTGCYIMSKKDEPVTNEIWQDCAMYLPCDCSYCSKTTFGLLRMCIPDYDGRILTKRSIKAFRSVDTYALQLIVNRWLSSYGLTVPLKSIAIKPIVGLKTVETVDEFRDRCITKVRKDMSDTSIMHMIYSGAKGTEIHASHMAVAIGQQYIGGKEGIFCNQSYAAGLTPDEFFGHQMAAREGVARTGVSTANTGYLNRRACKIIANLKLQYNGTVADNNLLSSFHA